MWLPKGKKFWPSLHHFETVPSMVHFLHMKNLVNNQKALDVALEKLKKRHRRPDVLQTFSSLFNQYLEGNRGYIPWEEISPLEKNDFVHINDIKQYAAIGKNQAKRVAYLKLNGGLGTSMGCKGAKSSINVYQDQTFLDCIKQHMFHVRETYQAPFPLILMNSFNTSDQTNDILWDFPYIELMQHEFPRINAESQLPFEYPEQPQEEWNPPGHGDVLLSLITSKIAQSLLAEGIDYVFVSNVDNLGPDFSPEILGYMIENELDFIVETTPKTLADVKGGTIVKYKNRLTLLERSQVEPSHQSSFDDLSTFSIFNTNNIWLHLPSLLSHYEANKRIVLPLIVNPKICNGTGIIQLETALGAAIQLFDKTKTVIVNRNRFLPVKKTSDLLVVTSDIVQTTSKNTLTFNADMAQQSYPNIVFDKALQNMDAFSETFIRIPSIKDLQSLTIEGPFIFKDNVVLQGNVHLKNTTSTPYVLENITLNYFFEVPASLDKVS